MHYTSFCNQVANNPVSWGEQHGMGEWSLYQR